MDLNALNVEIHSTTRLTPLHFGMTGGTGNVTAPLRNDVVTYFAIQYSHEVRILRRLIVKCSNKAQTEAGFIVIPTEAAFGG